MMICVYVCACVCVAWRGLWCKVTGYNSTPKVKWPVCEIHLCFMKCHTEQSNTLRHTETHTCITHIQTHIKCFCENKFVVCSIKKKRKRTFYWFACFLRNLQYEQAPETISGDKAVLSYMNLSTVTLKSTLFPSFFPCLSPDKECCSYGFITSELPLMMLCRCLFSALLCLCVFASVFGPSSDTYNSAAHVLLMN